MKKIIILIAIILLAFTLYFLSKKISPGSYDSAETYQLNVQESDLIALVTNFKEDNPQFKVPQKLKLIDHRNNHWYVIYFYFPDQNQIIYTWTRPSGKRKTTWALVSVNNGAMTEKWKDINKDLDYSESHEQIKRFEELVLNPVKEAIK
jgi:hypothetical protein